MNHQNSNRAGEPVDLASCRKSINRLPLTLRPSLNQQLAQWEVLFPFEQKHLTGFLGGIDSLSPSDLDALTAQLRALEVKMDVSHWNFSETGDTLENAGQLARSSYFAEWRHEVQRVSNVIEARATAPANSETAHGRLILLFLPENLPVASENPWKQWEMSGHEIKIAGDASRLRALVGGQQTGISSLLAQNHTHNSADVWFVDADAGLTGSITPTTLPAASCLSYSALKPFRDEFLRQLNRIPKDMTAADQTVALLRQADWKRWWPAQQADQERLRSFVVNLYLSGNGALIFSNAFVEWAASEALRRARPRAMVACFGMRSKPKPFTSIAIFENQQRISPEPDVDDPENSAIDAMILAHYIWLAACRYPEYEQAMCLCVCEHLNTAYVVAPPEMNPLASTHPVTPEEIYGWIAVQLNS
jgi:hypothetical protein